LVILAALSLDRLKLRLSEIDALETASCSLALLALRSLFSLNHALLLIENFGLLLSLAAIPQVLNRLLPQAIASQLFNCCPLVIEAGLGLFIIIEFEPKHACYLIFLLLISGLHQLSE
jgi:hypothetical protein